MSDRIKLSTQNPFNQPLHATVITKPDNIKVQLYQTSPTDYNNNNAWQYYWNTWPRHLGFQFTLAFILGLILAPWSDGLLFLILFIIIYEILYACYHQDLSSYNVIVRSGVILAYFLGWIVGRLAWGDRHFWHSDYDDGCQNIGCADYRYPLAKHELGRCSDCRKKRGQGKYRYRRRRDWLARARKDEVDQLFHDF